MKVLEWERKTIKLMIKLYCREIHQEAGLCTVCSSLMNYAYSRIERCPFGEDKPRCSYCTVHCYRPDMREKIREVMRYAGPRMMYHHPFIAIRYMLSKIPEKLIHVLSG